VAEGTDLYYREMTAHCLLCGFSYVGARTEDGQVPFSICNTCRCSLGQPWRPWEYGEFCLVCGKIHAKLFSSGYSLCAWCGKRYGMAEDLPGIALSHVKWRTGQEAQGLPYRELPQAFIDRCLANEAPQ
jgi:hypothetical protein